MKQTKQRHKSSFIQLNPYLYNDTYQILENMNRLIMLPTKRHTHSISYHLNNQTTLIFSLFHKGAYQYNINYNYKT